MLFYCCSITSPAGNSGRQKGYTRHVKGYDEMKRIVSLFLKGVLVSALVIVSCACSQSGSKPSQKKGMPVAVLHSYGAVAVIDTNGTELFDASAYRKMMPFSEGVAAVVDRNGLLGFVNVKGEQVIPCQYKFRDGLLSWDGFYGMRMRNLFHAGHARVETPEASIFIDKQGNQLLKEYKVVNWNDKVAIVMKNDRCGLVTLSGQEIIPVEGSEFRMLYFGDDNILLYEVYDRFGYIDMKGNVITGPDYKFATVFVEGQALVCRDSENPQTDDVCVIDTKGKVKKTLDYNNGLYECLSEERGRFLDPFPEGVRVAMCSEGDEYKPVLFNNRFDAVKVLDYNRCAEYRDGLAAVMCPSDGHYGFMDTKGELVIPCQYEDCGSYYFSPDKFSEGLCFAKQNNKWTVIDKKGKTISVLNGMEPMGHFVAGRACVRVGRNHSHVAIIDRFGHEIPVPEKMGGGDFFYSESDNSDNGNSYWDY